MICIETTFDGIFVVGLPGVINSLCLDAVSARMGVGHMLLPAQLPGTHWVMIWVIQQHSTDSSRRLLKTRLFSEY